MSSHCCGKREATLKDMFSKPQGKKPDKSMDFTPSPPIPSDAGSYEVDDAPVARSFLEELFSMLRDDLVSLKQDITADVKDLKKDFSKLGQRVDTLG
ncbi:hypothetical protein NDU88_005607 [Pleurodeles waltl]|uniref:Uncharacterized protein n=1 Tax=Pleurodeles waltl TaxID=8319 RepID=A0AAV7VLK2_PLEWA|nr:hypothetical protein NDU88_005607 [Pleurodeles waltl]